MPKKVCTRIFFAREKKDTTAERSERSNCGNLDGHGIHFGGVVRGFTCMQLPSWRRILRGDSHSIRSNPIQCVRNELLFALVILPPKTRMDFGASNPFFGDGVEGRGDDAGNPVHRFHPFWIASERRRKCKAAGNPERNRNREKYENPESIARQ